MLNSIDDTLDCKCLKTLYILAHGASQGEMTYEFGEAKGGRAGSKLAEKLKKLVCKPCKIVLMGCESGVGKVGFGEGEDEGAKAMQKRFLGGFAQMLAFHSGCEVVSMVGRLTFPEGNWNVERDNGPNEARTPGTVRTYNPDGNWKDASVQDYDKAKLP